MGDALIERLNRVESSRKFGVTTAATTLWLRNPDGPEAASRIAELEAELATAVRALEPFAAFADRYADTDACLIMDDVELWQLDRNPHQRVTLTVGDLRRAKSVADSIQERT